MMVVVICEKYGWTIQEYDSQPLPFIATIKHKLKVDWKAQEKANKKIKRK